MHYSVPTAREHRLSNGLRLIFEANHTAPVIAAQAWVLVGGADETPEQAGLAHLHEHMLFKGTHKRGVGEIARLVEAAGGDINAWTSYDQTNYHVTMPSSELGVGLDVLADALQNSTFDPDELQRESEVVVEEIHRSNDDPDRRLSNALFSLCFKTHPYRLPILGTEASVRGMRREGILKFYKQHYRPDNVVLVVVGDATEDEVLKQVHTHFGSWHDAAAGAGAKMHGARPADAPQTSLRVQLLAEDVKKARVGIAWHGPSMMAPQVAPIDLLSMILGAGESSRLFAKLFRELGLVEQVGAYAFTPKDTGLIMLHAALAPENTEAAIKAMLQEVARLRDSLVASEELHKAKTMLLCEAAFSKETMQGQARKLGFFAANCGSHTHEAVYTQALKAVTPQDIQQVARELLHNAPSVVVQYPKAHKLCDEAQVASWVKEGLQRDTTSGGRGVASASATGKVVGNSGSEVQVHKLPSGATLLLLEEPTPVVGLRSIGLGGLRFETAQTNGLSALSSSLFGSATQAHGPTELAQRIASLGGALHGFAGRNTVGLNAEFATEQAWEGLQLFAQVLSQAHFDPATFEREQSALLQHIASKEDHPAGLAFELFYQTLYGEHPLGLPMSGDPSVVKKAQVEDAVNWYHQYLQPSNLVLAVFGDVEAERVKELLTAHLSGPAGHALSSPAKVQVNEQRHETKRPLKREQAHVVIGAHTTTMFDEDRYALEVLTCILSGQSGRLFLDLRDKQSLAYTVSASASEGLDVGNFWLYMGCGTDKLAIAKAGLYKHLDMVRQAVVSPAELQRAQKNLLGTHAIGLQRSGSRAMLSALNERYGLGHAYHLNYPGFIKAVTAEKIQAVAQKYLAPNRLVEAVLAP